jgi:hypothetical protein
VAIAEGKFLSTLSPSIKKRNPMPVPAAIEGADADDEDTEEDIESLIKDTEAAFAALPAGLEQSKPVSALLLKVRGFIAKVSFEPPPR